MAEPKTRPTVESVDAFLATVPDAKRKADAIEARDIIREVTGVEPVMWGAAIVGYGSMPYTNTSGTYDWPVIGFSPRKAALTIYGVYDDYAEPDPRFERLGEFTVGKGCLYIRHLDRVDQDVLRELIREVWERNA